MDATVQETHLTCAADCWVLENNYVVLSTYGSSSNVGVFLLTRRCLKAGPAGCYRCCRLKFRVPGGRGLCAQYRCLEGFLFSAAFLDNLKQIILVGDWNTILDPKIDKVGRRARGSGRCESSLIDFMARHDLVDRFRLDHPGREMWTGQDSSPSVRTRSYQDSAFARSADTYFVKCPTFHYVAQTDHRRVRVSLRLADRPSLVGYWKFNTSLLEIRDFWDQLESLVQPALVGAVTGN